MVSFGAESIEELLSTSDAMSRDTGLDFSTKWPTWHTELAYFLSDECPLRTYFSILIITLMARGLSGNVDVLRFQVGDDNAGYSAQALAKRLVSFAPTQGINLRTKSSNPVNNQPFTFVKVVTADLRPRPEYKRLFAAMQSAGALSPSEAREVLALAFRLGRASQVGKDMLPAPKTTADGIGTLRTVAGVVGNFVSTRSDNGKVGQALGAALLDVLYGSGTVVMAQVHDPGFTVPGDFHAGTPPWLVGESKQTPVTSGSIESFLSACAGAGIRRAVYLALSNANYPQNIDAARLHTKWDEKVIFQIRTSPADAIAWAVSSAPGTPEQVAQSLALNVLARMQEIGCSATAQQEYVDALHEAEYL